MNIDAYLDHRRDRQKRIQRELNNFLWVNFIYMLFFLIMLVKYLWIPDFNCEIELIVLIFYYGYALFSDR